MNPVGQQLVLSGIVPFRANMITCSLQYSLLTNMVVEIKVRSQSPDSVAQRMVGHVIQEAQMTKYFLSLFREEEKLISRRDCFSRVRLKMEAGVSFLFFVCLCFPVSFPKRESQSQVGLSAAFHKLLGNFLASSGISSKCILRDAIKFVPVWSSQGNLSVFEITRASV